jgi:hypothetical protein
MPKKLTVNDIAHLFKNGGELEVNFDDEPNKWYGYNYRYEIEDIRAKWGEREVTLITIDADDGDEHIVIYLEGEE